MTQGKPDGMETTLPTGTSVFTHLGENLIHQGQVVAMYDGRFEGPDGVELRRDIIRHPGAVSVVAVDDEQRIFLVRQYRAPIDADLWEIPAGKKDVIGEEPMVCAARELREEVGMVADEMEHLIDLHHSPGFCDELQNIFLATGLTDVGREIDGAEEAHMLVERVPLADAVRYALDGTITDGKSIIGILAAARKLGV